MRNPLLSERKWLVSDSFYIERGAIATLYATFRRMRGAIGARFGADDGGDDGDSGAVA